MTSNSDDEDYGLGYQNTLATAVVDGCNSLGHVVGKFSMELAICKAQVYGVGIVSARGSNHYGLCSYYTLMAVHRNMIGFSCTNTIPTMAPTRSKRGALGSNPLSLAMAAGECDQFVLDMATTAVSLGKIETAARKGERIPEGWALDESGASTTDAKAALKAQALMPAGGHKGYGLSLMVEVLCGILSGSKIGPDVGPPDSEAGVDLGHCFLAINPAMFIIGSSERLAKLLHQMRSLPFTGKEPVAVPGDYERMAVGKVNDDGGIAYRKTQLTDAKELAKELSVEPMKLVCKSCRC